MKTVALFLLASLSLGASVFAGHELGPSAKSSVHGKGGEPMMEPCFHDREFQIDLFGTYNDADRRSPYFDGYGGGLALTYFFMRYVGIGIEGNVYNGGSDRVANVNEATNAEVWNSSRDGAVWQLGGRLLVRFPLELSGVCIAPYAFAGGGAQFDGLTSGTGHVGGGLEWRATPAFALFGEGRYTWAGGHADSAQARVGVRLVF